MQAVPARPPQNFNLTSPAMNQPRPPQQAGFQQPPQGFSQSGSIPNGSSVFQPPMQPPGMPRPMGGAPIARPPSMPNSPAMGPTGAAPSAPMGAQGRGPVPGQLSQSNGSAFSGGGVSGSTLTGLKPQQQQQATGSSTVQQGLNQPNVGANVAAGGRGPMPMGAGPAAASNMPPRGPPPGQGPGRGPISQPTTMMGPLPAAPQLRGMPLPSPRGTSMMMPPPQARPPPMTPQQQQQLPTSSRPPMSAQQPPRQGPMAPPPPSSSNAPVASTPVQNRSLMGGALPPPMTAATPQQQPPRQPGMGGPAPVMAAPQMPGRGMPAAGMPRPPAGGPPAGFPGGGPSGSVMGQQRPGSPMMNQAPPPRGGFAPPAGMPPGAARGPMPPTQPGTPGRGPAPMMPPQQQPGMMAGQLRGPPGAGAQMVPGPRPAGGGFMPSGMQRPGSPMAGVQQQHPQQFQRPASPMMGGPQQFPPRGGMVPPGMTLPPTNAAGPVGMAPPGQAMGAPPPHQMMGAGAPVPPGGMSRMMPPQQQMQPQQQQKAMRPPLIDVLGGSSQPIVFQSTMSDPQTGVLTPFPPASANYICTDTGQANCRYMRPTSRLIPSSSSLVDELKFPIGVCCSPFADANENEPGVQLSEWVHEHGPIRCARCRGYLNCFSRASTDFSRWECSLCHHENETPVHYRSFAVGSNLAELRCGSVEFEVPDSFFGNATLARANYLFVVDASQVSLRSGLFSMSLRTILNLTKTQSFAGGDLAQVGVVTFDENSTYFFELGDGPGKKPRILISGDCDEGFSPLPSEALLIPQNDQARMEELIQFVSTSQGGGSDLQANPNTPVENISAVALLGAYSALRAGGGRVVLLTASMCNKGCGKLVEREQPPLIGTDNEQILYVADKEEKFYNELSLRCLNSSVAVDVFVCGAEYVDGAALVQLPSTTGGTFERIPHFQAHNPLHRQQLDSLLRKTCSSVRAMSAIMKARTSSGVKLSRYLGHGFPDDTSFRVASITSDYCIALELEHDGTKLEDGKSRAVVQLAILYVNIEGKRRLRIHNLALQAKDNPGILLGSLDPCAVGLIVAKQASLELADATVNKVRDNIIKKLCGWTKIQNKYRGFTRSAEPFELITLYVNSLFKSPALLLNRPLDRGVREPYARADARIVSRYRFLMMNPERFSLQVYPGMYDLTPSTPNDGAQEQQFVRVPCSSEFLRPEGIFLLWDGSEIIHLFVGAKSNPQMLESLLGALPSPEIKVGVLNERRPGPFSSAVYSMCQRALSKVAFGGQQQQQQQQQVMMVSSIYPSIAVNLANGSVAEFFAANRSFLEKLVEDKIYAEQSYFSFVNHIYQVMESNK